MKSDELKRILTSFADSPANVDISKGELLVEIHNVLISCTVTQENGLVYIEEEGRRLTAEKWVIERLGQLPVLADRILNFIKEDPFFVRPRASSLDRLEDNPREIPTPVDDALQHLQEMLDQRHSGTSSIIYLTSDAGEGKTNAYQPIGTASSSMLQTQGNRLAPSADHAWWKTVPEIR